MRSTFDLRHGWETAKAGVDPSLRPAEVAALSYSVEPVGFIDSFRAAGTDWHLATPLYYDDFVEQWSDRLTAVVQQLVDAPDGGVLIHCFAGRDRAGLAVSVVLDLVGASHQAIIEDHWLSFDGTDVETALDLPAISGGILPLTQDKHREIMTSFLSTNPGQRALGDRFDELQALLHERLVG